MQYIVANAVDKIMMPNFFKGQSIVKRVWVLCLQHTFVDAFTQCTPCWRNIIQVRPNIGGKINVSHLLFGS